MSYVVSEHRTSQVTVKRLHSLDALRSMALLLGLVFHSLLPYVASPQDWAVGTSARISVLVWLHYYLHSFRLEVFFLLAGFFGALIVARRGLAAWIKDRAVRIGLVFLVALIPMKVAVDAVWIWGGRTTGSLRLYDTESLPVWQAALAGLFREHFPAISTTHLWFLYYLSIISALWSVGWVLVERFGLLAVPAAAGRQAVRAILSSRLAPVWLALATTPVLTRMSGMDIDTPDQSLAWHRPTLALYGFYFAIGWALHDAREPLRILASRWRNLLIGGVVVSFIAASGVALRQQAGPWALANADALRWSTSFGTSLAMALSVLGWIGVFIQLFDRPFSSVRYLSDASYWMYIVHLPVMTALQVWWAGSGLGWWIQVPLINLATAVVTLVSYHLLVKSTWVGAWINGNRNRK